MSWDHQVWYVGTSHGKPALDCISVTLTHFQGHRGQVCESMIHHKHDITTIARKCDPGSSNFLCTYL